jgi:hypothetical protein
MSKHRDERGCAAATTEHGPGAVPDHGHRKVRSRSLALLVGALVLLGATLPGTRADARPMATTATWVDHVYTDFLFRAPTDDELTWWTTAIGNGTTRTYVVNWILTSDEFRSNWVLGVAVEYLSEVDAADPVLATMLGSLQSSGNYLATEATVLAGAQYFVDHGSTNAGFLTGLYTDVFNRTPDTSGYNYYLGQLNGGTSRNTVASSFLRSNESAGIRVRGLSSQTTCTATELTDSDALLAGSYCLVLDRMADPSGAAYWTNYMTTSGNQITALWTQNAASNEYFNNS